MASLLLCPPSHSRTGRERRAGVPSQPGPPPSQDSHPSDERTLARSVEGYCRFTVSVGYTQRIIVESRRMTVLSLSGDAETYKKPDVSVWKPLRGGHGAAPRMQTSEISVTRAQFCMHGWRREEDLLMGFERTGSRQSVYFRRTKV